MAKKYDALHKSMQCSTFKNGYSMKFSIRIMRNVFIQKLNAGKVTPPQNTFCLYTTGEWIFEDRMKQVAPSAKLAGVGSLPSLTAMSKSDTSDELVGILGAIYFIGKEDEAKIEELAFNRTFLTYYEIYLEHEKTSSDTIDCLSMDQGLLPHAFPLPVYLEFLRELSAQSYTNRLSQIGAQSDYTWWLEKKLAARANQRDTPTQAYTRPSWFVPPPMQPLGNECQPQFQEYKIPDGKFCVFVANELVFEEVMKKAVPSATIIGAGMLWDRYIALGGRTAPGKEPQYRGFDRVWGVAYEINGDDWGKILEYSSAYSFFSEAEVRTIVKESYETPCQTYDIGLLPSCFPYQVFHANTLNMQQYLKRLRDVGVPQGYVEAIEHLAESLKVHPTPAPSSSPGPQESIIE